jgi:hypothetical protein
MLTADGRFRRIADHNSRSAATRLIQGCLYGNDGRLNPLPAGQIATLELTLKEYRRGGAHSPRLARSEHTGALPYRVVARGDEWWKQPKSKQA